jgi:hypothetical protein
VKLPEHVLGQGEVLGRQRGGPVGVPRDDGFGQGRVLSDGQLSDLRRVGLGVEPGG